LPSQNLCLYAEFRGFHDIGDSDYGIVEYDAVSFVSHQQKFTAPHSRSQYTQFPLSYLYLHFVCTTALLRENASGNVGNIVRYFINW